MILRESVAACQERARHALFEELGTSRKSSTCKSQKPWQPRLSFTLPAHPKTCSGPFGGSRYMLATLVAFGRRKALGRSCISLPGAWASPVCIGRCFGILHCRLCLLDHISHAGTLISAILRLTDARGKSQTRAAEAITVLRS
jgi:hypothetical protein